jgi:hypothetical protein
MFGSLPVFGDVADVTTSEQLKFYFCLLIRVSSSELSTGDMSIVVRNIWLDISHVSRRAIVPSEEFRD